MPQYYQTLFGAFHMGKPSFRPSDHPDLHAPSQNNSQYFVLNWEELILLRNFQTRCFIAGIAVVIGDFQVVLHRENADLIVESVNKIGLIYV